MRKQLVYVATAVALMATAGCDDPDGNADPRPPDRDAALTGPTHWRQVCVSTRYSADYTIGVATAENTSSSDLTLIGAALTDADGLDLVGTDVVRPGNLLDSFGVWNGYPPMRLASLPEAATLWERRAPVAENRVKPGERINFILHLTGTGRSGPVQVTYRTAAGSEQTWTSNIRYLARRTC